MTRLRHFLRLEALPPVILLGGVLALFAGCNFRSSQPKPSVTITHVPRAGRGGSENVEQISGTATTTAAGQQIVLYARTDSWWVQPFRSRSFTRVEADSTWSNVTHVGAEYAALLVVPGYHPQAKIQQLPSVGGDVLAMVIVKGIETSPVTSRVIRFSGYDWTVRAAPSARGGEMNQYDPDNVSVDQNGYLHLRMGDHNGVWSNAEVSLTRSLGYGTYRFVVQDTAHLPPSAVVGMFTVDDRDQDVRSELDIELSRWGKPVKLNADYTVQPYYLPENTVHFSVPAGTFTHTLHWEPGEALFKTFYGTATGPGARELTHHVFTSSVPVPGIETIHIDLYDFYHTTSGLTHPSEVVIEKFEYLP